MSKFVIRHLSPRSYSVQPTTPFLQNQCTSGSLCGQNFAANGCYASPDYSTCHYEASEGASVCTICICYGFESGQNSCDQGSPTSNNVPHPSLFLGSASKRFVPFKSFVFVLLWFSVWFHVIGISCLFWYLSFCVLFAHSDWCFFVTFNAMSFWSIHKSFVEQS
jgi:hypothetical protein